MFIPITAHILREISIGLGIFFFIGLINPREKGVLGDIVVATACDFVEPLQILIVGDGFIDPS